MAFGGSRAQHLIRFCSRSTACFDAAGGARIFPQYLAERGAGGLLLLQGRQRLSEPQQCVRGFRRFIEFGGHPEKGFRGVAIFLALEIALAQPVLRSRRSGDRWDISPRSCAWSLRPARSPCAAYSRCRDRTRPSASPTAAGWSARVPRRARAAPGAARRPPDWEHRRYWRDQAARPGRVRRERRPRASAGIGS